jgi:bifunctional pyridoxal-dependent enzyme with beta-cystathionase and maltose regulon repressor activities
MWPSAAGRNLNNGKKASRNNHMTSTEMISFELSQPALQARRNAKWNQYDADVLPAFVADMDFAVAAPIQAAIERIVRERDYGYPLRNGERADRLVANTFAKRMQSLYGWELSPDLVMPMADLVQGTYAAILAFSDPGDGVVLQVPNYPPFRDVINTTERKLLALTMRDDGSRYAFDMAELKRLVDKRTRIFILCNPQNPTGRVFSRDELLALGHFVIERDLIVISDEIHSDLVFPGPATHPLCIARAGNRRPHGHPQLRDQEFQHSRSSLRADRLWLRGVARSLSQADPAQANRSAQYRRHRRNGRRLDGMPALA